MKRSNRYITAVAMGFLPVMAMPAAAAPVFDALSGDHSVIQRDRPALIRGRADPGEMITITLGAATQVVTADAQGRFQAGFAALTKAGPIALSARSDKGQVTARDVVVGDVFLCSGQSNMELEVRNAQDAMGQIRNSSDEQLRLITVPREAADQARQDFASAVSWKTASPESVPDFSAACYYTARDLRKTAGVPIGAISSSWGGSQISPWMGEVAQAAIGRADRSAMVKLHASDPIGAERAASAEWGGWWRAAAGEAVGQEPWQPGSTLGWADVPKLGPWEEWGVSALSEFNGMVWFRREIILTAAQAAEAATLSLGTMDDVGRVWINGSPVGMSAKAWQPTSLTVPPGLLKAGRNVLIINVMDNYANGGLLGPASDMALRFADGGDVPLGDKWRYAVAAKSPPGAPRVPWADVTGAGTLFNGMIAPLGAIGLKGVAWYQGESDVDLPGYADRLAAMMAEWREQFRAPDLPFVIVQLAAYGKPTTKPSESGWARMRDTQYRAVAADPNAALATAIDLGDPFDIHPGEKQELGRRLARSMRAVAYGERHSASGPQAAKAIATPDGGAMIEFSGLTGALQTRSAAQAIGFELCGQAADSCRYVGGEVEGLRIRLAGDGQPAVRVRYGWADSPVTNLYDEAPLPVGSFELPIGTGR